MLSFTVIISTYNRRRTLARTLEALLAQSAGPNQEIVVVDDCSADDTRQYMEGMVAATPTITYLRHAENRGRVVTRNDGIEAAHGDVLIFLDDDNTPDPGFVAGHMAAYEAAAGERIAVMGNARFADESTAGSNFGRFLQSRYLGYRTAKERAAIDFRNLPSRFFGTLNCSARKSDLTAVGMFDPQFRYYGGEDEDMGDRLRRAGVRIVFAEAARTVHYDDISIGRYKKKLVEASTIGLAITRRRNPEYIETTQIANLLPIDWRADRPGRVIRKLCLAAVCNPPFANVLEWFVMATDSHPAFYSSTLNRLLTATWVYRGYRADASTTDRVEYHEAPAPATSSPGTTRDNN